MCACKKVFISFQIVYKSNLSLNIALAFAEKFN